MEGEIFEKVANGGWGQRTPLATELKGADF